MEASALTHASRRGLLARRSPLLRLQGDDRLVALVRAGNDSAFEVLWDRYRSRLLSYCRSIVRSAEDAEDVLQDVFVNAHVAMVADEREIQVRPWLYRIARNRSLNHLRQPVADGQDTMDGHLHAHGASVHDDAERRENVRQLVADVKTLPETQRTALVLREMNALSYQEIAQAMETTIPSVKSLLVRARISLAETSESRLLNCDEVRVELAAAAEGIAKVNGPMRRHVRDCEECRSFRKQLRSDGKALAALSPIGILAIAQGLLAKLFGGAAGGSAAGGSARRRGWRDPAQPGRPAQPRHPARSGTAAAGGGALARSERSGSRPPRQRRPRRSSQRAPSRSRGPPPRAAAAGVADRQGHGETGKRERAGRASSAGGSAAAQQAGAGRQRSAGRRGGTGLPGRLSRKSRRHPRPPSSAPKPAAKRMGPSPSR